MSTYKHKLPNVEIKSEDNNVLVTKDNQLLFKQEKTKQTVAIANALYFYHKYGGLL